MSDITLPLPSLTNQATPTPRAQRGAAAVVAQYIQDLTHPSPSTSGAAAA